MTALREIFARFGTQFDDSALQRGQGSVESLTEKLKGFAKVLAGSAVAIGIRSFVNESAAIGDELDKTSRVIGINAQALQGWRHAANLSGVGAEAFNTSMIRLQRSMFDAQRGTATALEPFQRLGVSFEDAEGQLRPVDEVLRDMADPLANLESSSERVALLNTIMGRSGARIGPLFEQGREGVDAMMASIAELGEGASQDFIQAAVDLTDANAELDFAFLSLRSRIGVVLLPIIQKGVEAFTRMTTAIGQATENTELVRAALTVLGGVAAAVAVKMLIAFGPALLALTAIGLVVGVVVLALDELFVTMKGGDSLWGRTIDSMQTWINKTKEQTGLLGALASILDGLVRQLERAAVAMDNLFGGQIEGEGADRLSDLGVDVNSAAGRRLLRRIDLEGGVSNEARAEYVEEIRGESASNQTVAGIAQGIAPGTTAAFELLGSSVRTEQLRSEVAERSAAAAGPSEVTVVQNNTNNINGAGLDEEGVERVLTRAQERQNRQAVEAFNPGGGQL